MIPSPKPSGTGTRPLHCLTTFRFFAAAAIVLFHTVAQKELYLRSGVSFFYILSGFILVYVHPTLVGRTSVYQFWIARWARIWPVHVFTFFIVFLLLFVWHVGVPLQKDLGMSIVLNLALLQSWIPVAREVLAFNGVSWSLSVEAFFYLLFPFLLPWVKRHPGKMLLGALALRAALTFLGMAVGLPAGNHEHSASYDSFILFCPLVHLHKFVFGMALAVWWTTQQEVRASWTLLEAGCLLAVVVLVPGLDFLTGASIQEHDAFLLRQQSADTVYTFFYGALLFVFAYERGTISRFLSQPWLVFLGEISFSIYMLHGIVLGLVADGVHFANRAALTLVSVAPILGASALSYIFIEKPARRALNRLGNQLLTSRKRSRAMPPADRGTLPK